MAFAFYRIGRLCGYDASLPSSRVKPNAFLDDLQHAASHKPQIGIRERRPYRESISKRTLAVVKARQKTVLIYRQKPL